MTQRGVRRVEAFFDDEDYLFAACRYVELTLSVQRLLTGRRRIAGAVAKGSRQVVQYDLRTESKGA